VVSWDHLPWKEAIGVHALFWWNPVVLNKECCCIEHDGSVATRSAPGLFLPPSAKISKDEH
jgi:hypothetical protein